MERSPDEMDLGQKGFSLCLYVMSHADDSNGILHVSVQHVLQVLNLHYVFHLCQNILAMNP